ncbi:MAG: efflux RND transporter periplasmic adaptor subunit [Alphaproteobacteria bacterium]|nr:efflux RND transporter periplasmic adaptor subunit [Alphaproteobacteria bacterium]
MSRATLLGLLPLAFLVACGRAHPEAAAEPPTQVTSPSSPGSRWIRTEPGSGHPVPTRIDAPGRVEVRTDADARLSLPVVGRVRSVLVREGTRVDAGAPLLVVDSAEVATLRAEAEALEIELRAARAEADRQARLTGSGVGLEVDRLRAEGEVRRTEAALEGVRSSVALFGPGAGGAVTLQAPIAGVVLDVAARPGMVVGPDGGPLVSVAHTDALHVRLEVFEDELRRVEVGQTAEILATDGSPAVMGIVVEVADAADPITRRGPVLVELSDRPEGWVAGRHVRGRLAGTPVAEVAVPVSAVVIRPDRSRVVYVEEEGGYVARTVDVGRVVDGVVPVLRGVRPDERVVVEGALLVDAMADRLL